VRAIFAKTRKR